MFSASSPEWLFKLWKSHKRDIDVVSHISNNHLEKDSVSDVIGGILH